MRGPLSQIRLNPYFRISSKNRRIFEKNETISQNPRRIEFSNSKNRRNISDSEIRGCSEVYFQIGSEAFSEPLLYPF